MTMTVLLKLLLCVMVNEDFISNVIVCVYIVGTETRKDRLYIYK